jgi:hypothetical protein
MGNFWDRYAAPHVAPAPAGQEQALLASLPTTRPSKTGQSMPQQPYAISSHLNNGMFAPTSRFPRKI